jgi:FkbH-like protein
MNSSKKWFDMLSGVGEFGPLTDQDLQILSALEWKNAPSELIERVVDALSIAPPSVRSKHRLLMKKILFSDHSGDLERMLHAEDPLFPLYRARRLINSQEREKAAEALLSLRECPAASEDEISTAVQMLKTIKFERAAVELAFSRIPHAPGSLSLVSNVLKMYTAGLPEITVGLLGYSTLSYLKKPLQTALAYSGFNAHIIESDYAQVIQELLSPGGMAKSRDLDALFITLDFEGMFAIDWRDDFRNQEQLLKEKVDTLINAIGTCASGSSTPVIVNSLVPPRYPTLGFLDFVHPVGSNRLANMANKLLAEFARDKANILMIDTQSVFSGLSDLECWDPKLWYYGRIPFANRALNHLALRFADAFSILKFGTKKVLALDLDNTIWGGILGEDGIKGLKCDDEFPGSAFKDFQRECLRLKSLGMVLVVVSKNNPDAIEVFDSHGGMLLKGDDFAGHRVNWFPKADNIYELSQELNLGLNSFVFLDDSLHERAAMRKMRPEVLVPELPADPSLRPQFLRGLTGMWVARLTDEDRRRTEMYKSQGLRSSLKKSSGTLEDYYRELKQSLFISHLNDSNIVRIAQLHMRTNQFNLTTARIDEPQLKGMMGEPGRHVALCGRAADRFGDHGIVITATF